MTDASSQVLDELVRRLALERLERSLFRGQSQDFGKGNVFGGQVLGQALSAASQTVPADRPVHSLHGYFLRSGDARKPIIYDVDHIRDGKSFTTRRVVAIQNGRAIFNMSASFQVNEEGFDHQDLAPKAETPDGLPTERQLISAIADRIPTKMRDLAAAPSPIDIRPIDPIDPIDPPSRPPQRRVWWRANGSLPDNPNLHRCLLAYASDYHFFTTAMRPHAVGWLTPGMQVASLDHAMWFHRSFRMDEWLLYDVDSPSASGARGLVRGRIFDRNGNLVASTAQEGLMRNRKLRADAE